MIPIALDVHDCQPYAARPALRPPAIVTPAPREVSFGRITGTVSARAVEVVVKVDGLAKRSLTPRDGRFRLFVALPPHDVRVTAPATVPAARSSRSTGSPEREPRPAPTARGRTARWRAG